MPRTREQIQDDIAVLDQELNDLEDSERMVQVELYAAEVVAIMDNSELNANAKRAQITQRLKALNNLFGAIY